MHHATDGIAHTKDFVTTIVEHWLERKIAQWVNNFRIKTKLTGSIMIYVICKSQKPTGGKTSSFFIFFKGQKDEPYSRRSTTEHILKTVPSKRPKTKQCLG